MDVMSVAVAIKEIGAKAVQAALDSLGKAASNASGKLQTTDKATQDLTASFRTLAGAVGAAFSAQQIGVALDSYTNLTNQLKLASTGAEGLAAAQAEVYRIAQLTRQPINDVAVLYGKTAQSAEALGLTASDAAKITEFVGKSLAISGTSADAARGALIQLSQALAAGTVRAEEFNSVQEGAPALIRAVEKTLGLQSGGLRKLAIEGRLSSEVFAKAMLANTTVAKSFADFMPTMAQQLTTLRNDFILLAGEIDKSAQVTGTFARLMGFLRDNLPDVVGLIGAAAAGWIAYQAAAASAAAVTAVLGSAGTISALVTLARGIKTVADSIAFAQIALGAAGGPLKVAATVAALAAGVLAYKVISAQVQKGIDGMAASIKKNTGATQQGTTAAADYGKELQALLAKSQPVAKTKEPSALEKMMAAEEAQARRLAPWLRIVQQLRDQMDAGTEGPRTVLPTIGRDLEALLARTKTAGAEVARTVAGTVTAFQVASFEGIELGISQAIAGLDAKRDEMIAAYERNVLEPAREMGNQLAQILSAGVANAFQALTAKGGNIGDAFKALGQTILSGLGDMLIRVGTTALVAAIKVNTMLATLFSPTGIAAALAVIALGGALKGAASRMVTTGQGAPVTAGGFGYTGMGGGGGITLPGVTYMPTAAGGMGSRVMAANPMQVTIIGPNDPTAQRQMQELIQNANRRGQTRAV
jgi:tape measure domain-containing protein